MSEATREEIKEAFKKTIDRWQRIFEDPDYYYSSNCPLCDLPLVRLGCLEKGCPIALYTKTGGCKNTPYEKFELNKTPENALAELNFLRQVYIWFIEKGKYIKGLEQEEKKEEWVDVTDEIEWRLESSFGKCKTLAGYYNHARIAIASNHGIVIYKDDWLEQNYKATHDGNGHQILKKV